MTYNIIAFIIGSFAAAGLLLLIIRGFKDIIREAEYKALDRYKRDVDNILASAGHRPANFSERRDMIGPCFFNQVMPEICAEHIMQQSGDRYVI